MTTWLAFMVPLALLGFNLVEAPGIALGRRCIKIAAARLAPVGRPPSDLARPFRTTSAP
jgi:hypothetical protein